jgi:hypothetical protein
MSGPDSLSGQTCSHRKEAVSRSRILLFDAYVLPNLYIHLLPPPFVTNCSWQNLRRNLYNFCSMVQCTVLPQAVGNMCPTPSINHSQHSLHSDVTPLHNFLHLVDVMNACIDDTAVARSRLDDKQITIDDPPHVPCHEWIDRVVPLESSQWRLCARENRRTFLCVPRITHVCLPS